MNRLVRVFVYIFLVVWTVIIFGYVGVLATVSQSDIETLYQQVPMLQYIGVSLGLYDTTDQYDPNFWERKTLKERLQQLTLRQQSGNDYTSDYRIKMNDERGSVRLYSPLYTFAGEVSEGAESIKIVFSHHERESTRTIDVNSFSPGDTTWQQEVSLGSQLMYRGTNTYLIVVTFGDSEEISRRIEIQTDYQRIEVGESVIYLDPYFIPEGAQEDILREAEDFAGVTTNFVTHGCDPESDSPWVLVEHNFQYSSLPACFSFSLSKRYVLSFLFSERQSDAYLFDVVLLGGEVLYHDYPLFTIELGNVYMGLLFWDQEERILQSIRMQGDKLRYLLTVIWYQVDKQIEELRLEHIDGHRLRVVTPREKLVVYMYKDWDKYSSLIHPGMRYLYYIKSRGDRWKKINEGSLAVSPERIYSPAISGRPTYMFSLELYDETVRIDDGIHIVSFTYDDIGGTLDAQEKEVVLDQPNVCDKVELGIYQDMNGKSAHEAKIWDELYLVGKGLLVSDVVITHNGKTTGLSPDWSYKGHIFHTLSVQQQNLVRKENIYTIKLYDSRGELVCTKELSLSIADS